MLFGKLPKHCIAAHIVNSSVHTSKMKKPHGLCMRGLNFLIHYNKVEVYALIFEHILFNSTLGRKTPLWQPILSTTNILAYIQWN